MKRLVAAGFVTAGLIFWAHQLPTIYSQLPFTLVPLLEMRGVANDPAVLLLDAALYISICSVPYFTLVARTVVGGVALSIGAFQALWVCGASACFWIMEASIRSKGGQLAPDATFEEFFRNADYRYLFYILCAVMLAGYCPALSWLGKQRFLRQAGSPGAVRDARSGQIRIKTGEAS